ncbi:unnamed protein product [Choristocarpus tenellus]
MLDLMETLSLLADQFSDFQVMEYMGTLFPGGEGTRQHVASVVGSGLDNLHSLGNQVGLGTWELLGIAVLSAITVYRKELSSNHIYTGTSKVNGIDRRRSLSEVQTHADDCPMHGGDIGHRCACAAVQEAAALAGAAEVAGVEDGEDKKSLRELIEQHMQSLNLPTSHLQQLHARLDSTWSAFSAVSRGGERAERSGRSHSAAATLGSAHWGMATEQHQGDELGKLPQDSDMATHATSPFEAINSLLLIPQHSGAVLSGLGRLPSDALEKVLSFLSAQELLAFAQVSKFGQVAADSDPLWRSVWLGRFEALWKSELCLEAAARWHLHGWDPRTAKISQVGGMSKERVRSCLKIEKNIDVSGGISPGMG